jgi:hypothetical protein
MTRLMRSEGKPAPVLDTVRVSGSNIQKGSLNDPALREGVLYFNKAKTNYLYLDGVDLYWQPANGSPIKLS